MSSTPLDRFLRLTIKGRLICKESLMEGASSTSKSERVRKSARLFCGEKLSTARATIKQASLHNGLHATSTIRK